ncbi:hypothetical protein [Allorhizocola rhizosphaerae]|uniref:hypothetical protein n=1 Tax=Allorhizocola rhizosphaerae TaxID=1872709 RepID=UPI0013C33CD9|nr:hypothetical protein [Allorhizocola rhizosphaerae]
MIKLAWPRRRLWPIMLVSIVALLAGVTAAYIARNHVSERREGIAPSVTSVTEVNWADATVDTEIDILGACPAGRWTFGSSTSGELADHAVGGRTGSSARLVTSISSVAYGDLTGDSEPEAVLTVACIQSDISSSVHPFLSGQLLAVTVRSGRLVGIGLAGPEHARYPSVRVQDERILAQVWYAALDGNRREYSIFAPAHLRVFEWNRNAFTQVAGREAPLVLAPAKDDLGSPSLLPTILKDGQQSACPGGTVRFKHSEVSHNGAQLLVTGTAQPADLDNDGDQELLVQIRCTYRGVSADSLLVMKQSPSGLVTIDVPVANAGQWDIEDGWSLRNSVLNVVLLERGSGKATEISMPWNGTKFEKVVGAFEIGTPR